MALSRSDKLLAKLALDRGLVSRDQVKRCLALEAGGAPPGGLGLADVLCQEGYITRAEQRELVAAFNDVVRRLAAAARLGGEVDRAVDAERRRGDAAPTAPDPTEPELEIAPPPLPPPPLPPEVLALPGGGPGRAAGPATTGAAGATAAAAPPRAEPVEDADRAIARLALDRGLVSLAEVRHSLTALQDLAAIGKRLSLGQVLVKQRFLDVGEFLALKNEVDARLALCAACGRPALVPLGPARGAIACPRCGGALAAPGGGPGGRVAPAQDPSSVPAPAPFPFPAPAPPPEPAPSASGPTIVPPSASPAGLSSGAIRTLIQAVTGTPVIPGAGPESPVGPVPILPAPSSATSEALDRPPDLVPPPSSGSGASGGPDGSSASASSGAAPGAPAPGAGAPPAAPGSGSPLETPVEPDASPGGAVPAGDIFDSLLGRLFGRYEILSEIARGGMGVVYRARDCELGRIVALKVLKDGAQATEKQVKRFKRETEAAAKLSHENIVPVHEVGCVDGRHYFTMDLIDGRPLDEAMNAGPLEGRRALEIAEQVARAIHHAHENGVIHRDLKPPNIILDQGGRPQITDFGLAKDIDHASAMTKAGAAVGTPFYMPPEQARGEQARIDRRADVYAIGVILYEMLTGVLPFDGETTIEVYHKILSDDPTPATRLNPAVDAEVDVICQKAMAKEPGHRYSTALELAEDIRRKLDGQPILARPPGRISVAVRRIRRHGPIAAAALTAVAAIAIAVGIALYVRAARTERERAQAVAADLDGFKKRVESARAEAQALRQRAAARARAGEPGEAVRLLEDAAAAATAEASWLEAIAFKDENAAEARRFLDQARARELAPLLRDIHVERGRALGAEGPASMEAALEAFALALRHDARSAAAWSGRGWLLLDAGRPAEALDAFDQAIALATEAEARAPATARGQGGGEPGGELELEDSSAASDPSDLEDAKIGRAGALEALGRYREAREDFLALRDRARAASTRGGAAALQPAPGRLTLLARAWLRAAACSLAASRSEEALKDLDEVVRIDQTLAPALILRAEAHLARGSPGLALRDATEAAALLDGVKGGAEGLVARSRTALALGDARRALRHETLGEALYQQALKDAREAQRRDPKNVAAAILVARAALRTLDPEAADAAVAALERVQATRATGRGRRAELAEAAFRLGELYRARGATADALAAYARALDLDARLGAARVARARLRIALKDHDSAERDLEAADRQVQAAAGRNEPFIEPPPGVAPFDLRAHPAAVENARGLVRLERGRPAEAAARFEAALGLVAGRAYPEAAANLGRSRLLAGDRKAATRAYLEALELEAKAPEIGPDAEAAAFYRLGEDLVRGAGDAAADRALRAFARCAAIAAPGVEGKPPRYARAHHERARALFRPEARGGVAALKDALDAATAACDANPAFADALALRARIRLRIARDLVSPAEQRTALDEARRDCDEALSIAGDRADALFARAEAAFESGNRSAEAAELALADLDRGLPLDPRNADAFDLRARVLDALGRPDEARADIARRDELRRADRAKAIEAYRASFPLIEQKRLAEAEAKLSEAIAADATFPDAWRVRAQVRFQSLKPLDAGLDYARAIELDPGESDPGYGIIFRLGDLGLDIKAFGDQVEEVLATAPESSAALFIRAGLRFATVLPAAGAPGTILGPELRAEAEKGVADLDRVIALSPRHAPAHVMRAFLEQRLGRSEDALRDAERAHRLDPRSPLGPLAAASVRAGNGDLDGAFRNLEDAVKHGFRDWEAVRKDPAFEKLVKDPRFEGLSRRP